MAKDDLIARSRVGLLVVVVGVRNYVGWRFRGYPIGNRNKRGKRRSAEGEKGKMRLDLGLHSFASTPPDQLISSPDCATHSKNIQDAVKKRNGSR